ncbi:hypothetical protein [Chamaesiphon sp.]|uniref:hypothetical protein n=1 Tax=Chamaesiphon sp. TaxID=2814140 RepID=UPI0035949431
MSQFHHSFITRVIDLYGLELDGDRVDNLVGAWLQKYDPTWIVKAIVESLYRGRYKIKSVDNILKDWQRLGKPRHNFTPDYEREILQNLPEPSQLAETPVTLAPSVPILGEVSLEQLHSSNQLPTTSPPIVSSENLNPEESTPFGRHLHFNPTHLVEESAVVDADLTNLFSSGRIDPDRDPVESLAPSTSETLQLQDDPISIASALPNQEFQVDEPAHRSNSQPVNHHLFATLKAIVDPNHQRDIGVDRAMSLPLYVVNPNSHQIKQFKLPIETIGEEQYR